MLWILAGTAACVWLLGTVSAVAILVTIEKQDANWLAILRVALLWPVLLACVLVGAVITRDR